MSEALHAIGARAREHGLDIGFVAMGFPPDIGGIETHLSQLALELFARGHRVHVLCLDSRSDAAPYTASDGEWQGVRVRRIAYRYQDQRALADLALRPAAHDVVMAWLAEVPCDIVHVQHAGGFGAGALLAIHDMGRPLLLSLHDYWLLCPRGQMWRQDGALCEVPLASACGACLAATWPHLMPSSGGERHGPAGESIDDDASAAQARTEHALAMIALAQRVFTPSAAAKAVFERAGVPPGRIQVLGNGVDSLELARRVASERAALPARGAQVRIGVLGSVQPTKGVLEFARALLQLADPALLLEVHGPLNDYHGDPGYADALRELAAREPRVLLCGPYAHADLAAILARLDAVAAPSLWHEVHGLGVREARSAGLFVFASDRGGLSEWSSLEGVEVLPACDPEAWSGALLRFTQACRAPGASRVHPLAEPLRSVHACALELEQHYVELVREQLGREPQLAFEPGSERPRASAAVPQQAHPLARLWRRLRGG